jgi:anti-sigma factor RsiW
MKCTQVRKHLPLLVGGDLDADIERLLESHLKACLGCYREYQDYTAAYGSLKSLSEKPNLAGVLDGLAVDVIGQLREQPGGVAARLPRLPVSGFMKLAAAAAMLAIITCGSFFIGQSMNSATGLPDERVETISSQTDPASDYRPVGAKGVNPALSGAEKALPAGNKDELKPEMLLHRPQQLPDVQPVSNRRGF